jgi:hypothetical protein
MLNQYYTHRGVNQPPYFKGFPMSMAIVLGIIILASMLVGFLMAITIGNLLIGTTFAIIFVGAVGYFSFDFLRKVGPFGYEKMLVKYFFRIEKMTGGRPHLHKIQLF